MSYLLCVAWHVDKPSFLTLAPQAALTVTLHDCLDTPMQHASCHCYGQPASNPLVSTSCLTAQPELPLKGRCVTSRLSPYAAL